MDENTQTPPPQPQLPAATPKQTNTLAIISLVSGIVGWVFPIMIGSLVAIIFGHMARAQIRDRPNEQEGDVMAVIGLVLGYSYFIIGLLVLLAIILFFGGLAVLFGWLGMTGQLN